MKTGTAPDWADEKAKRLLDDPWGKGVAGDIVDGVARALRDAHAEGMNEAEQIAKKHAAYGLSGWHIDAAMRAALSVKVCTGGADGK